MDTKTIKMGATVVFSVIIAGLILNYGSELPLLKDSANGFNNSIL